MQDFDTMMLSEEEMEQLKQMFYQQAIEMLDSLNQETLGLESATLEEDRKGRLKTIKRVFHTLKGDSASIGLKEVSKIVHKMEDLMAAMEDGSAKPVNDSLSELIFNVVDEVSKAITTHQEGREYGGSPELYESIDNFIKQTIEENEATIDLSEYEQLLASNSLEDGKFLYKMKFYFSPDCLMKSAGTLMLAQHLPKGGEVIKMTPDAESPELENATYIKAVLASTNNPKDLKELYMIPTVINKIEVEDFQLEQQAAPAREQFDPDQFTPDQPAQDTGQTAQPQAEAAPTQAAATVSETVQTIRVNSDRIDQMMDLVGELVMGRSMIGQLVSKFEQSHPGDELVSNFVFANSFIERSLSDLQRSVMSIRMVPIGRVFKKFPRMVRDLSRASDKSIHLDIVGETTEVDKALVDTVGEPLLHLIRNAVDHGIEFKEERLAADKTPEATIKIEAYHQGNDIIIEVEDDGRGIDTEKLKQKAIEKGVITKDEAARMDEKEATNLIFSPGFSTAKTVSDVSGRGIGMDIVKSVVDTMRGSIKVKSVLGEGTKFTLRFPLTLAIIRAILFNIGDKLYALPLGSITEILRVFKKDLDLVAGKEVMRYREKVLSLLTLDELVGTKVVRKVTDDKLFVVVFNHGDIELGLVVDNLVGEEELVVKTVAGEWINTDIVGGASILGDGTIVMILNVASMFSKAVSSDKTGGNNSQVTAK